jgi:uncharacterized protein (TIGR00255 family)
MIQSMTAFARETDQGDWGQAFWEIRSVNHRYLDMTVKLPESLRDLEMAVRSKIQGYLKRGKVDCFLRFQPGASVPVKIAINESLLNQLGEVRDRVASLFPGDTDLARIMQWPGLVQIEETDLSGIKDKVLALLETTLSTLTDVRAREGERLKEFIVARLASMRQEVKKVIPCVESVLEEQREKIKTKIASLNLEHDEQRLEQELVYQAQKLDVTEELDRLAVHIDEVQRVLDNDDAVGRRLDFLMQELNREANTLGSKSADSSVTKVSVELKVLIEQMREQVQNLA